MPIKIYNTVPEFLSDCDYAIKHNASMIVRRASGFLNSESLETTLDRTRNGYSALVPKAETLMTQLETQIPTESKRWEPNVAGAYCSVPDFLSGWPTNMRRQVVDLEDHQPINIYVITTSSADIPASVLERRGVVILALVMALTRIRPVSLWAIQTTDGQPDGESVLLLKINTTPLDLARACYILTSAGFDRRLFHGVAQVLHRFHGSWTQGHGFSLSNPQPYYNNLMLRLGNDLKRTLVIPASRNTDALLLNPVTWVNSQVNRFTAQEQEAA